MKQVYFQQKIQQLTIFRKDKIPFTSVGRKVVKSNAGGAFCGSSYAGSFKSGNIGVKGDDKNSIAPIDFKPLQIDEDIAGFSSSFFDKIWALPTKILDSTSEMLKGMFNKQKIVLINCLVLEDDLIFLPLSVIIYFVI